MKTTPALVVALVSALLLSAVVPATVYTAIDFVSLWGRPPSDHWELYRTAKIGPLVMAVALGHAILLGLPLALVMRHRRPMTVLLCLVCGFLVGAVPWFILGQLSNFMGSASVGGRDLSVNGIPTLYGVWAATVNAAGMGCLGAFGGLAFWATLRLSGITLSGDFAGSLTQIWTRVGVCFLVIAGIAAPVWKLPDYFEVRSCHNLFRNGASKISPIAILNVGLPESDWSRLRDVFVQISNRHRMSLWDDSSGSSSADIISLSLCNEQGTYLEVNELRFAERPVPYAGVYISLYKTGSDPLFSAIAGDFVQSLATNWPSAISVQDSQGRLVSAAEFLRHEKNPDTEFLRILMKKTE